MADINVERKGPSVWPWIIGLVVLALLIWALVEMFGDRPGPAVTGPGADTLMVVPPMETPTPAPGVAPTAPPATTAPATPQTPGTPVDTVPGLTPAPSPAAPNVAPATPP